MQAQKFAPMLFLPSLESEDFITVANVSREEATDLVGFFDGQVGSKRKTKQAADTPDSMDIMSGNLNLKSLIADGSLNSLVERLTNSQIRGARGRRAVFLDVENDTIGVGTTVVYNENRAMTGVNDPSSLGVVLDAVTAANS